MGQSILCEDRCVDADRGIEFFLDLFLFAFNNSPDVDDMQRMLEAPVSVRMREKIEKKLNAAVRGDAQITI